MSALICGSMAYDTIMVFDGHFKDQIHPDHIHILNVSFMVPHLRREFGGCAGNVAYNLKLLGSAGVPMATVGQDFAPYRSWLKDNGVDDRWVLEVPETYTAQAYITTDLDDNQITAFHPGAMGEAHRQSVPADAGISIGLVSPDGREGMVQHAREFAEAGIPFGFDPGQGLPMFDGQDLKTFVEQASWVIVNDYESRMLEERTGLSAVEIAGMVEAYVVTRGAEGSCVHTGERVGGACIEIPPAKAERVTDPTGCGDAYRAGLIHGLMQDYDWETAGRCASLMGAIKVARHGTQNHSVSPDGFRELFHENFGYTP